MGGFYNGKKVIAVAKVEGGGGGDVDVPSKQANVTIIANALTNINGRVLSAYEASNVTISGYPAKKITYGGENLTEERAKAYMEYMTGSDFLPKYNYEKPQNSIFLMADYTLWKPQYDNTNGLLLFQMGQIAKHSEVVNLENDLLAQLNELKTKLENGTIVVAKSLTTKSVDNVSEESGSVQETPFISQGTGTENNTTETPTSSVGKQLQKQGNSVVVNQLIQNPNFNGTTNWSAYDSSKTSISASNNILSQTFLSEGTSYTYGVKQTVTPQIVGHKYLIILSIKTPVAGTYAVDIDGTTYGKSYTVSNADTWTTIFLPFTCSNGASVSFILEAVSPTSIPQNSVIQYKNVYLVDLTQLFGSNDNIPAHLLSHPEDFFRYYQGSLAYNTGELVNSNGRYLKTIGRQQWDEEVDSEYGYWDLTTGEAVNSGSELRCKNFIRVIPNNDYALSNAKANMSIVFFDKDKNQCGYSFVVGGDYFTFKTPSNCCYIKFNLGSNYGTVYNNDITISIYYDGESGYDQYFPYEEPKVYDTGAETLLAFDKKTPDGTIYHNTIEVDLSLLYWVYDSSNHQYYSEANANWKDGKVFYSKCPYDTHGYIDIQSAHTRGVIGDRIYIVSATEDSSLLTGTMQVQSATPTTEQGTPFSENIEINDYGTMTWLDSDSELVEVPQGCKIFYPADYVLLMDDLYKHTNGDASSLALLNDLLPKLPSASEDATYTLKATKSGSTITYFWNADE